MDFNAAALLASLAKYPQEVEALQIRNFAGNNGTVKFREVRQYMLDIARPDPFGDNFDRYKGKIQETLADIDPDLSFIAYSFWGHEKENVKPELRTLADELHINANTDVLIDRLNISRMEDDRMFYVVVTVITYQIPYLD